MTGKSIITGDIPFAIAEEGFVGDRYDGECLRELRCGRSTPVTVSVYKRRDGTHFLRVMVASTIIRATGKLHNRYHVDLDRYANESDFLKAVLIGAGAAAEKLCEDYGEALDPDEIAKEAVTAARRCLREIGE